MQIQPTTVAVNLEHRYDLARHRVRKLLAVLDHHAVVTGEFDEIGDLLKSLPLAADQYAVASRRLANANRYQAVGERGAAEYELRLLEGSLVLPSHLSRAGARFPVGW